jgi:hypothetical protein
MVSSLALHDHALRRAGPLPDPGLTGSRIEIPNGGMYRRPKIEIAFVDASGRRWIRWQDGTLHKLKKDPTENYGLTEPLDWG